CEFLKDVDGFKNLTPTELTHVAESMTKRHYLPGEAVIVEGETGHEMYLISDGEVRIERAGQELARLGPGEFFGEPAPASRQPRNATVVAPNALETYVLGEDEFRGALEASANFREQLRRVYFSRH